MHALANTEVQLKHLILDSWSFRQHSRAGAPMAIMCHGGGVGLHRRVAPLACHAAPTSIASPLIQLPHELGLATACVQGAGGAAYILGISHASRVSCQHARQILRLVPAHTLLLELCGDRVGLLVDPNSPPPSCWRSTGLRLSGLPSWLSADDVAPLLHAATGKPITERSIAQDVAALKATGVGCTSLHAFLSMAVHSC